MTSTLLELDPMGRRLSRVIRILLDARSVHPGLTGIGRYTLNLLLALDTVDDLEVSALIGPAGVGMVSDLRRSELLAVERAGDGWTDLGLPDLIAERGTDIFHSPLFVLPSVRPCPCVITLHDIIPRSRPDLAPADFRAFFEASAPHAVRAASAIITVSEFSMAEIVREFPDASARTRVVYQPVSPRFHPLPPQETLRQLDQIGVESGYVLFAGSIDSRKGIEVLLDAWTKVLAGGKAPPLLLAGGGSGSEINVNAEIERRGLEGQVKPLGRVSDDDLVALYCGAVTFVFPSLYEGFGLPVLEAMACGTPVITTTASSLPEVAGAAAMLVAPGSVDELAAAIRHLIEDRDLRRGLSVRGVERASRFALSSTAKSIAAVYSSVVEGSA